MKFSSETGWVAPIPIWLVEAVSPRAVCVFAILTSISSKDDDEAQISKAKLAERCGIGVSTLEAALRELVEAQAVEKVVRKSGDGSHQANAYMLRMTHPENRGGGQDSGGGVIQDSVPPSLQSKDPQREVAPIVATSAHPVPKALRIDGRDLAFDAVAEVCGIREGSPRARGIPAALNGPDGIRAQAYREITDLLDGNRNPPTGEEWERALAEGIRRRAGLYRSKMPGVALTPSALKKWWTDLPGMPAARDGRSGSGAEIIDAVDAAVRRERERSGL